MYYFVICLWVYNVINSWNIIEFSFMYFYKGFFLYLFKLYYMWNGKGVCYYCDMNGMFWGVFYLRSMDYILWFFSFLWLVNFCVYLWFSSCIVYFMFLVLGYCLLYWYFLCYGNVGIGNKSWIIKVYSYDFFVYSWNLNFVYWRC